MQVTTYSILRYQAHSVKERVFSLETKYIPKLSAFLTENESIEQQENVEQLFDILDRALERNGIRKCAPEFFSPRFGIITHIFSVTHLFRQGSKRPHGKLSSQRCVTRCMRPVRLILSITESQCLQDALVGGPGPGP